MTDLQRVHVRMSEVRQKLNTLGAIDAPTEEQKTEIDTLRSEYETLEVRFRGLVTADNTGEYNPFEGDAPQEQRAEDAGDGEARELAKLEGRLELRAYLSAAVEGRSDVDGAEREFNEALGVRGGAGIQVPWAAVAPPVEHRVDAATNLSGDIVAKNVEPILGRVFEQSVAMWLGVTMPMASVGQRTYPVFATGAAAEMANEGADVDADAATFTVTNINPTRLSARYLFSVEDLATVEGLEAALRSDLSMAMSDQLDEQIVTGDGTAPNLAGLFDDQALGAPTAPTAEADVNTYIDLVTGQVDGVNAYRTEDVRMLIGPDTLKHAAKKFIINTDTSALAYVNMLSGGYRVSARVPAAKAVGGKQAQELLTVRMNGVAVAPMWPTLSLVRDIYSGAKKGQVSLTAIALYGFKIVRNNGWARQQVRIQA